MRKKIFALITALALVATCCLLLVACNEDDGFFTGDMSQEEIIEKLGEIENCTVVYRSVNKYNEGSTLHEQMFETRVAKEFLYEKEYNKYEYEDRDTNESTCLTLKFIEGAKVYRFDSRIEPIQGLIIADYTGYDIESFDYSWSVNAQVSQFVEWVKQGKCVVENGNLIYSDENEYSGSKFSYVLKDCNKTKMPSLPDKYKDYKNMDANKDLITYNLSVDGTYYIVRHIDSCIKSYEVPATHNDIPVKEFDAYSYSNLKSLTLPTSIVKMGECRHDAEDGELQIIYKGTKTQWGEIENHENWEKEGIRITCSDGEYVY